MHPSSSQIAALVLLAVGLTAAGCSTATSTVRRTGLTALGGAGGAIAGYALGDKDPVKTAAGTIAGAALTQLALGEDPEVQQQGFDQGYIRGQSDAIKRQYFLRHALEAQPPSAADAGGDTVYYVMPGPEVTSDGRKLEPHQVAVRVIE